ncbi:MAG TPA: hypothetical protein VG759_10770 [Candidatus Angelobacter sp.]|nr:hypothetical protein [Candidatus Angelobacter sp.]
MATYLLEHFCVAANKEALAGDLIEQYQEGRSANWYWRQVMTAIGWRRHAFLLLQFAACSWMITGLIYGPPYIYKPINIPLPMNRPLELVLMTALFWLTLHAACFISDAWRIGVILIVMAAMASQAIPHKASVFDLHFFLVCIFSLQNLLRSRALPPFRELSKSRSDKESNRPSSSLEQSGSQESHTELR